MAESPAGRVLLVEDDTGVRRTLARHLERSGYEVTALSSARTLFGRGVCPAYDVVVSDVHLPGVSGIELAGRLLAARPTQPIVLITADPDEALAREALARGPVSYLLKPFELFELDAALQQAQAQQRRMRSAERRTAMAELIEAGRVPEIWLAQLEATSAGGTGHALRVSMLATRLASGLAATVELAPVHLELAARHHEVGRIAGPTGAPVELALRSASVLASLGFADTVVRGVRHMYERWDGAGEPDGLRGWEIPAAAQVLAAADAVDHYAGAWLRAGASGAAAVDRAIRLVLVQQMTVFSPHVAAVLQREREFVQRTCLLRERWVTGPEAGAAAEPGSGTTGAASSAPALQRN